MDVDVYSKTNIKDIQAKKFANDNSSPHQDHMRFTQKGYLR